MRFKYDTKKIGTKHYIVTSRLVSEFNDPDYILTFPEPFDKPMTNDKHKLQWRVEVNPDYDKTKPISAGNRPTIFINDPIPQTPEEVKRDKDMATLQAIHKEYSIDDEIKLINSVLEKLDNLPIEYKNYRDKIKEIKNGIR